MSQTIPFLDPPASLSLGELRRIIDEAGIEFSLTSPFGFLLCPGEPVAAAGTPSGRVQRASSQPLDRPALIASLRVLAKPDARVRLSVLAPGAQPALLNVFAADGRAAYAFFDTEAFHVSRSMPMSELTRILAAQVAAGGPSQHRPASYLDFHLKLLGLLWPGSSVAIKRPIASHVAVSVLSRLGLERGNAARCLQSLAAAGCIIESGDAISLHPSAKYWMSLLWSGYCLEVERKILRNGGLRAFSRLSSRLVFLGPPGNRCLCHGTSAARVFAEAGALGDPDLAPLRNRYFISFERLESPSTLALLNRFFRYVTDAPPAAPPFRRGADQAAGPANSDSREPKVPPAAPHPPEFCRKCGAPTRGRKYCGKCGSPVATEAIARELTPPPMAPTCGACGAPTHGKKFCRRCGQAV
jgi:hypothetical protein